MALIKPWFEARHAVVQTTLNQKSLYDGEGKNSLAKIAQARNNAPPYPGVDPLRA